MLVGPTKQRFVILENLARFHSEYFEAALKSDFQEAHSNTFELPEDNASVFAGYVHYLYTKQLRCNDSASDKEKEMYLVESYLLGERRGTVGYRNAIMSALSIVWKLGTNPTLDAIMLAFDESMQHSKLRRLIVDKCAWEGSADLLTVQVTERDATIPGFGLELSLALLKRMNSAIPSQPNPLCPRHRANGSSSHVCHCGGYFTAKLNQKCDYFSPPSLHTCKNCSKRIDLWQKEIEGPKLILETEAPYSKSFCA